MKFCYLQKSDRRTIIVLLCLITAAVGVIWLTNGRKEETVLEEVSPAKDYSRYAKRDYGYYQQPEKQPARFAFDPNTADSTQLLRLGLRPGIVKNIYRYRAAGGVFRHPSDFKRLYGLSPEQYRELEPYIRIREENLPSDRYFYNYEPIEERDTVRYPIKLQPQERIVLNDADTTALRKVPGVGSHFAHKIVEYRERLGGYCRVQQLLEIEDFPETAVNFFIIPDGTTLRKINLNRMSMKELKRHPYINFYQARAIIDYRRLHGRLDSLAQLRLLRDFTPEAMARLLPYVEY